ncbi:hypothetical protein ATER59S_00391 [Aquamicrobium terrae]
MSDTPARLPDATTVKALLKDLDPVSADTDLAPALSAAFPGFSFSAAPVDDFYWRGDAGTVIGADGARLGDHKAWVTAGLAALGGDLDAFWNRHRESGLQFSEWRGSTVFAFAPTGPGVADFIQIELGREFEVLAGAVVEPDYRSFSAERLLDPDWVKREPQTEAPVLAGPVYRLQRRGGLVHMRSFLATCQRLEREHRERQRPQIEARTIREVGPVYDRETPFLDLNPGWLDVVPRENRFFADWQRSSAGASRVFEHWAFDIKDYEERGRRQLSFIPRPLKMPADRLAREESVSIHRLMERIEAIDAEIGLPFAWFFLMTHGHWVGPDVGEAVADGLRAGRVRLPDRDAAVLIDWAAKRYLF